MFQTFRNAWKIPELKNRLLFTLAILVVYRLGCAIPVPFVSGSALTQMFANGDMLSYLNMMSGGALARCTLFALGVTPYINASIIVQLLTVAIPALENLAKEADGQQKLQQINRYAGAVVALIMSIGYYFVIRNMGALKYVSGGAGIFAAKYQTDANFNDVEGRLPAPNQERNGTSTFSGKPNFPVLDSWILYQNGQFVGDQFGDARQSGAYQSWGCNMYPGIIKHTCGYLNAFGGDSGSRDIILARLAETYLIRAEIKVRLNDYPGAKTDIDEVRKRGAWHEGENRSYYVDGTKEAAMKTTNVTGKAANVDGLNGRNLGMNSYYLSNPGLAVTYASTENVMTNWSWDKLPAEDEAILAKIGVSGQFERALHFILNEHTRELVGEFNRWEHLSRTKTIETRAVKLNPDVRYFDAKKHYLRPIPQTFLDNMQNPDGTNLSDAQKAEWQNPGY